MKTTIGIALLICAYLLLIPGITQPMLTLTGSVDKAQMLELGKEAIVNQPDIPPFLRIAAAGFMSKLVLEGRVEAYEKSRSIIGTIKDLADTNNYLVAFLIALFSIFVPVVKGLLVLMSIILRKSRLAITSNRISGAISKWSMADVYVIAVIVAFMAANATQNTDEIFTLNAVFGPGFYYFLSYCLLSILSSQLLRIEPETLRS